MKKKSPRRILGEDGQMLNDLASRFDDITLGHLPWALKGGIISNEEFAPAAIVVTVSVAMAFFANVHPDDRNGLVDDFLKSFADSFRSSMQTQNMFDMKAEGQA